jgi:hypothetical protein
VKIVADSFPVEEPIYEFGALQLAGFEDFADLQSFFSKKSPILGVICGKVAESIKYSTYTTLMCRMV